MNELTIVNEFMLVEFSQTQHVVSINNEMVDGQQVVSHSAHSAIVYCASFHEGQSLAQVRTLRCVMSGSNRKPHKGSVGEISQRVTRVIYIDLINYLIVDLIINLITHRILLYPITKSCYSSNKKLLQPITESCYSLWLISTHYNKKLLQ